MEKENEKESNKELQVEKRTIEDILHEARTKKDWSYVNVIEELSKMGVFVDEKTIKKWEVGLEYPDTDIIYKLSELYFIPARNLIMAKSNSYAEGYKSIHTTFIKWFCYFTGLSIKIGYVVTYVFLYAALVGSFMFFISKCNEFLRVRGRI